MHPGIRWGFDMMNVDDIRRDIMPRVVAWLNALPNANHWHDFDRPVEWSDYEIKIVWQPEPNPVNGCGGGEMLFIASGNDVERLRVIVDNGAPDTVVVINDDADTFRIP